MTHLQLVSGQPLVRSWPGNIHDDEPLEADARELDYFARTLQLLVVLDSEPEDLAYDVFLALRRARHRCDPTRPLRPYRFGTAFRVAASRRRRHWREIPSARVEEAAIGRLQRRSAAR